MYGQDNMSSDNFLTSKGNSWYWDPQRSYKLGNSLSLNKLSQAFQPWISIDTPTPWLSFLPAKI